MSKSKVRETEERLADLRLRTSIAATNYEVTSAFHLTPQQLEAQRNAAEFRALQAEEAEQLDRQRKNQPAFKLISQQWSKPIDTLQCTVRLPDVGCQLPLVTQATDVHPSLVEDFIDLQKSRNIVYSKDGILRLILYLETMSRTSQVIDGTTYYVANTLDCWRLADLRLLELNAYQDGERGELLDEPQPQVVEEPSANELLREANAGWFAMFEATWSAWLKSLAQDPWNFVPDEDQKIAAIKMLQQFGTTPDSWDRTRRSLGRSGVWPNLATADEVLAEKVEAGEFRLDTEAGRRAYMIAHNQITYNTLGD